MAKKIRVHELAKELGIDNADCLKISQDLGISVTKPSSSMEEPQADRVRRKAPKLSLKTKATEPKATTSKASSAESTSKVTTKTATAKSPKAAVEPKATTSKASTATSKASSAESTSKVTTKTATAKSPKVTTKSKAPRTDAPKAAADATTPRRPTESAGKPTLKTASEKSAAPSPPSAKAPTATSSAKPQPRAAQQPKAAQPKLSPGSKPPARVPLSRSGKPIPPPPTPSRSTSRVGPRRPPRGSLKPGVVLPSVDRSSPSAAPKGRKDGKTNGGPRQPQLYQPRRRRGGRRRRRAPIEELQPVDGPLYTPQDAPVPEGKILIERGSMSQDIAPLLNRTTADLVKYFLDHGETITATVQLSDEMIELYALEVGADVQIIDPGEELELEMKDLLEIPPTPPEDLKPRGPVVTVMGHVDHGKTKLLDQIRNADVARGEKGGITQHIGAYQVLHNNTNITFIDTPGHQAFTSMRSRGASSTDLVVLVVAADDGVMPQTIEAIDHAKAAGVPILVAVNKIDLENKDVNRVLQQIAEQGLVPESYGGDILVSEVSATEGTGIDDLLEKIILLSELEELKTVLDGRARGVVLESNVSPGQGPVATLLIKQGTLSVGNPIVAGAAWGKVRALIDHKGEKIKIAQPSAPVQVLGLSQTPQAGTEFVCAPNESTASKVAEIRSHQERSSNLRRSSSVTSSGVSLEDVFSEIQAGESTNLNLIVKADTYGSLEAVTDCLATVNREKLKIAYVHKAVGGINENDVQLALASNATIIGFNIRPEKKIRDLAAEESVDIRTYEVIYSLVEDVEDALKGMLVPEYEEVVTGEAEVREVFHIKGVGSVAGCFVRSGKIAQNSGVRFLRNGTIIWKGEIKSLKRFTDDVQEVQAGNECGIGLSDFQDLKKDDIIETYENQEIEALL